MSRKKQVPPRGQQPVEVIRVEVIGGKVIRVEVIRRGRIGARMDKSKRRKKRRLPNFSIGGTWGSGC